MPAAEALRRYLNRLSAIMLANEEGVRQGIEPATLHDFRVALRRTRAAVGQLGDVWSPDAVAPFSAGFRWLGAVTGPCRDLDVMTIEMPAHLAALPASAHAALLPLTRFLSRRRREAHASVAAALGSARYRRLMTSWQRFLETGDAAGDKSAMPVERLGRKRLRKLARRVARRGGRIDQASSIGELHRLRIDGKKLRYTLELLRPLLPPAPAADLIGSLKSLQNHLGGWHDRMQQQRLIEEALARMTERDGSDAPGLSGAAEALLRFLDEAAEAERREVGDAVESLLPSLLGPPRDAWLPSRAIVGSRSPAEPA